MIILLVLLPALLLLIVVGGTVGAIALMRRRALEIEAQNDRRRAISAATTSYGSELFERSVRLDTVQREIEQARRLTADSYVGTQVDELCTQLEAEIDSQHSALSAVAPLTGRARAHALNSINPAIDELENGAQALRELSDRVAQTTEPADESQGAIVERRARAVRAAIDELESLKALEPPNRDLP